MKKIKATFCFLSGTFSGKKVYELFVKDLWFEPETIFLPRRKYTDQKYAKKHKDEIESKDTSISLWLKGKSGINSFQVVETAHRNFHQVIYMSFLISDYDKVIRLVESQLNSDDFVVGYCHDEFDQLLQNASSETDFNFINCDMPEENLIEDDWGSKIVDTQKNPGVNTLVGDMWLTTTWRMWFGKNFYKHVNKELLKNFKDAHIIQEVGSDALFIELYSNYSEASLIENREKQIAFREHVEMDKLIAKMK